MTQGRRAPQFVARAATEKDADSLGAFTCATGPWFEREVEEYAREHALRRVMATPSTYRLLVLTGIVAQENVRSMACCERNGLRSQVAYDDLHVRLSGHFARR